MAVVLRHKYISYAGGVDDFTNNFNISSVQADIGDTIIYTYFKKKVGDKVLPTPSWNGQAFTPLAAELVNDYSTTRTFTLVAESTTTATITCQVVGYPDEYTTGIVAVRVYSGITSIDSVSEEKLTIAGWAQPSLLAEDVASTDVVDEILMASGFLVESFESAVDNNLLITQANSQTLENSLAGAAITSCAMYHSTKTGTGDLTLGYTTTAGSKPAYVHNLLVLRGSSFSINSIDDPIEVGSTGIAITTTGLDTLTSLTFGGKSFTSISAPSGDGTANCPQFTDGGNYPAYGEVEIIAGDGNNTASTTVVLIPDTTQDVVTLTSINSDEGYLGFYVDYDVTDVITFNKPETLSVENNSILADGTIQTDYVGSQIAWVRSSATGIMTRVTILTGEVAGAPDVMVFTNKTNAELSTVYASVTTGEITGTSLATDMPISVVNGQINIANAGWVTSGVCNEGDSIAVRGTSGAFYNRITTVTISSGSDVIGIYKITVKADPEVIGSVGGRIFSSHIGI
jgi:hypothetical protein